MGVPSPRVASVMGLLGLSQWVSQSGDVVCIQRARGASTRPEAMLLSGCPMTWGRSGPSCSEQRFGRPGPEPGAESLSPSSPRAWEQDRNQQPKGALWGSGEGRLVTAKTATVPTAPGESGSRGSGVRTNFPQTSHVKRSPASGRRGERAARLRGALCLCSLPISVPQRSEMHFYVMKRDRTYPAPSSKDAARQLIPPGCRDRSSVPFTPASPPLRPECSPAKCGELRCSRLPRRPAAPASRAGLPRTELARPRSLSPTVPASAWGGSLLPVASPDDSNWGS